MSGGKRTHFYAPGSPLHGKRLPPDWAVLDAPAKRRALVTCGLAKDYSDACRVMGRHSGAVGRSRRWRQEQSQNRRKPEGDN